MKRLNEFRLFLIFLITVGFIVSCTPKRQVDGVPVGTVIYKTAKNKYYTVVVKAYGRFLVTKEEFDKIKVGEKAPRYILERGE